MRCNRWSRAVEEGLTGTYLVPSVLSTFRKKVNAARAEEDKKVAEAQASFLKIREDYRHKVTEDLVGVDKDIAELEAKIDELRAYLPDWTQEAA